MKVKFTDTHRYPQPYVPSGATDITKVFRRERERLKLAEAERGKKVRTIREVAK